MIHGQDFKNRWYQFDLSMQLANIGSEFSRAMKCKNKDEKLFWGAVERFLELINLSIIDPRLTKSEKQEIRYVKEVACDKFLGTNEYGGSVESLQKYFDDFALIART